MDIKKFKIKRIRRYGKYWVLYLKDRSGFIVLPVEFCYGELSDIRLLPWQCHDLNIKLAEDFVIYACLDGLSSLFYEAT